MSLIQTRDTRTEPINGRDAWRGAGPEGGLNPSRTRTQDQHRGPEAPKGSVAEQFYCAAALWHSRPGYAAVTMIQAWMAGL